MSVTDVPGFVAAGHTAGIKSSGLPDMALVATDDGRAVSAAGVFTRNQMTAAPVLVCKDHLSTTGGRAAAVILNSGNANAATGARGHQDAEAMCTIAAAELRCAPAEVLVCSTGWIGYHLPMDLISAGIPAVAAARHADGGLEAARAIMTTDTVPKTVSLVQRDAAGVTFRVGGIAKGAAMLEPNMATMLGILTTDADVEPGPLTEMLQRAVAQTFNLVTVDGAQSTNDTVLVLASGSAGAPDAGVFQATLTEACRSLAVQMADDAEGSTKTVFLRVTGAATDDEAAKAARDTANCQLVKCSWYGEDPYWGRIASEMGAAGVRFDPETLLIRYGDHVVYDRGEPATPDPQAIGAYMTQRHLDLWVDLGQGTGSAEIITTDLSHAYIDENMRTS